MEFKQSGSCDGVDASTPALQSAQLMLSIVRTEMAVQHALVLNLVD